MHETTYQESAGAERPGPDGPGRDHPWRGQGCGARRNFERAGERLMDYLRTRTADHWIMFVTGLVAGLLLA